MHAGSRLIYLDHAATTPMDVRVEEAMRPFWTHIFGDGSICHSYGRAAFEALEAARRRVAVLLGCEDGEIFFTGSATESDNLALRGVLRSAQQANGSAHLITTSIEHHAISATAEQLRERLAIDVTVVPVDATGRVDPAAIARAIRPDTALISVMYANNEVGTVQPIAEIGAIARAHGVPFHTDAVQAAGTLPLDVEDLRADLLTLSAHKFYGPKGSGVLYIRRGIAGQVLDSKHGGSRPGTADVAGAMGLAVALEIAQAVREQESARLRPLRDRLIAGVLNKIPEARLTGHPAERLANSASFAFRGLGGEAIALALDLAGICASTGSACTTGSTEPSFVLTSMGLPAEWAAGSLRLTLGRSTTVGDVDAVLDVLPGIIGRLRAISPHFAGK